MFQNILNTINSVLWGEGSVLIVLLVTAGIWFSIKLNFVQFRHFRHMFGLLRHSTKSDSSGISSFQALSTSLSARVGMGNLAGVAFAISVGGPGAVFWMWVIALLGMATGYAESLLAQVYKVRNDAGEFRGGPAYYIELGLGSKWLAVLFAVCLFLGYGLFFSAMQANTIASALNNSYGLSTQTVGIAIVLVAGPIVAGGLRSVARFAELIVPFMGAAYVITALTIVLINIDLLPSMLSQIVLSAFGLGEAGAGALGFAIKVGIQRGLFSNEAGSGSAPHAAAGATPQPNHPAAQGYVQMLGVLLDTIVLCTCTAVIILLSGFVGGNGELKGIEVTQQAMQSHLGEYGGDFVAIAITLFAFTSVVANFAYAQSNLRVFKLDNRYGNTAYVLIYLAMVFWGTGVDLEQVVAAADVALGLMTIVNVIAIALLTPTVIAVSQHYFKLKDSKQTIRFKKTDCVTQGSIESDAWD